MAWLRNACSNALHPIVSPCATEDINHSVTMRCHSHRKTCDYTQRSNLLSQRSITNYEFHIFFY